MSVKGYGADRRVPNILITGTPGCGKTTLAESLVRECAENELKLVHVNVGELVRRESLHEGKDKEFDAYILDEDKVCDALEDMGIMQGGFVVDFHSCDFFAERYFDLIVILRTNNTVLYDRLKARGYSDRKVTENIEAEIFGVCAEEARDSYKKDLVIELTSEAVEELEENKNKIIDWMEGYMNARQ